MSALDAFAVGVMRSVMIEVISEAVARERHRANILQSHISTEGPPHFVGRGRKHVEAEIERLMTRLRALRATITPPSDRSSTLRVIDALIEAEFGLTRSQLAEPGRSRKVATPRLLAMFLAREMTTLSLPQIARRWGRSDHTTAFHAVRSVASWAGEKAELRDRILTLARGRAEGVPADGEGRGCLNGEGEVERRSGA